MTLAHWVYVLGAVAVLATMVMRKGVVVPSLIATFAVGWAYKGGFLDGVVAGLEAIYNANIMAAKELFGIILLIAFMVGMLNALKRSGASTKMVGPIQKLMVNGHVAYWVLFVATAIISTTFWPTPAVPLVGALLMPAAYKAGLSPMGIAMTVTIAGQGMALAADALMRVAPALSAKAAGHPELVNAVWSKGIVLSLIIGVISSVLIYISVAKSIRKPEEVQDLFNEEEASKEYAAAVAADPGMDRLATILASTTIITFVLVVVAMFAFDIKGGDAGALIGGAAALVMLIASFATEGGEAFEEVAERLKEGFMFAVKVMGSIIPIAALFFLGGKEHSAAVFGDKAPGFLFDIVTMLQAHIPQNPFIAAFGVLLIGMICGVDGSGFAGLPITGALSGALAQGTTMDPTMLAAVGQMGSVWTGGGTIIPWSTLLAVAGFAGVNAVDVARKCLVPVLIGLVVSTIIAVLIW